MASNLFSKQEDKKQSQTNYQPDLDDYGEEVPKTKKQETKPSIATFKKQNKDDDDSSDELDGWAN